MRTQIIRFCLAFLVSLGAVGNFCMDADAAGEHHGSGQSAHGQAGLCGLDGLMPFPERNKSMFPGEDFRCRQEPSDTSSREAKQALQLLDLSPALFVENKGQWEDYIRYAFQGKGANVLFTDSGPVFQLLKREGSGEESKTRQVVLSATFVGANRVAPVGAGTSATKVNYYHGSDPSEWQSDVPTFGKMAYMGLYDGVDLYVWGKRSGFKYEFHVAPGADWRQIRIAYEGISGLRVDGSGALAVGTPLGQIIDDAPMVYQETPSGRIAIRCSFRLTSEFSYGFEVSGLYDPSLPLVIDPELAWGTYLGGSDGDCGSAIAIDGSGNAWVTGYTLSSDFPKPGGFDTSLSGGSDAFVAKIAADGTLAFATYLGGSWNDHGKAIAIDGSGNAWVAGSADSPDFPTPGGFDKSFNGYYDAFVARITPAGKLAFASYLGGGSADEAEAVAIDGAGNAWVTGYTNSSDFPTPGAFQTSYGGGYTDAFVARITPAGTLAFASYLGGSGYLDWAYGIAIDTSGNAWITGETDSDDFPTPGGFDTSCNSVEAFVVRIAPPGTVTFGTYLGGGSGDAGYGIDIDASGNCWVAGLTQSSNFPTPGGFDLSRGGYEDAFVAKITSAGALAFASYLGGGDKDVASGIVIDVSGNVWVTGYTRSGDFPTPGAFDTSLGGDQDRFVALITPAGSLGFASYLGGSDDEAGILYSGTEEDERMAVDAFGNAWVTGSTASGDFPTPGGFRTTLGGSCDAFVAKITGMGQQADLQILTPSLPDGQIDVAYSRTLQATGGIGPYSWSLASGDLPGGLSLSPAGVVSGTPTTARTFNFMVQVTDSESPADTATKALSIHVPADLVVTTTSLPGATVAAAYSQTLSATGGKTPYNWSVTSGSLPTALTLDPSTGVIHGTPTVAGTASFTVRATDSQTPADTAEKALSIGIVPTSDVTGPMIPPGSLSVVPNAIRQDVDTSATVSATADDTTTGGSTISQAECFIGSAPAPGAGTPMNPADGAFDSPLENLIATLDTISWASDQEVSVRARDAAGNWGAAATITVPVVDGTPPGAVIDLVLSDIEGFQKVYSEAWQTAGSVTPVSETKSIDLGAPIMVAGVSLTPDADLSLFPRRFEISGSTDNENWEFIGGQYDYKATAGVHLWQCEPKEYRYVRITADAVRSRSDGHYYVKVAEVGIFKGEAENRMRATWTATADNGTEPASGAASAYDLHYSQNLITPSNFLSCSDAGSLSDPKDFGQTEDFTFGVGSLTGKVYAALRVGDEVPNWSGISNVSSADVAVAGLLPLQPSDDFTAAASPPSQFTFSAGKGVSKVSLVFCDRPDFPVRGALNNDGTKSKTLRIPLKAGVYTWKATAAQWIAIKKMFSSGKAICWRLEGISPQHVKIAGPTRRILFETGDITDLEVTPSHVRGADEAVWPDKSAPSVFTWTNNTTGMAYFFIDVSSDSSMPMSDKKKAVSLGGKGITTNSYTPSNAEWKKVRQIATWLETKSISDPAEGVIYWRVRALDADRALSCASGVKKLVVDGGEWTLDPLDLSAATPTASWTHVGDGISKYGLEFSVSNDFSPSPKEMLKIPAGSITGVSYILKPAEVARLANFATRNGVTELYWRVRGEDADKAFVAYSQAGLAAVP